MYALNMVSYYGVLDSDGNHRSGHHGISCYLVVTVHYILLLIFSSSMQTISISNVENILSDLVKSLKSQNSCPFLNSTYYSSGFLRILLGTIVLLKCFEELRNFWTPSSIAIKIDLAFGKYVFIVWKPLIMHAYFLELRRFILLYPLEFILNIAFSSSANSKQLLVHFCGTAELTTLCRIFQEFWISWACFINLLAPGKTDRTITYIKRFKVLGFLKFL